MSSSVISPSGFAERAGVVDVVRAEAGRERPGAVQSGRFGVLHRRVLQRDLARERQLPRELDPVRRR